LKEKEPKGERQMQLPTLVQPFKRSEVRAREKRERSERRGKGGGGWGVLTPRHTYNNLCTYEATLAYTTCKLSISLSVLSHCRL